MITVNPNKSVSLIIPPKERYECPKLSIQLDSSIITIQESSKYLGILIDNKLNFCEHIHSLETKLSRSVGLLSKLKYKLHCLSKH